MEPRLKGVFNQLRLAVVRSQRIKPIQRLFSCFQDILLWGFVRNFKRYQDIHSIWVKGSMVDGTYLFGESDIDGVIFLKSLSPSREFEVVSRIFKDARRWKNIFRITKVEHVFSERDLRIIKKIGKDFFIFNPLKWRQLTGEHMNKDFLSNPLPPQAAFGLFPLVIYWYDVLINDFLMVGHWENSCLRNFYKIIFKICLMLHDISCVQEGVDIFKNPRTAFIKEIPDEFLKKLCEKSESLDVNDFYSLSGREEIARACACLLKWMDQTASGQLARINLSQSNEHINKKILPALPLSVIEQARAWSNLAGPFLEAVIHCQDYLYLVVKESGSIDDLTMLIDSGNKTQPCIVSFWTKDVLNYRLFCNPFWHRAYLASAQVLFGPNLDQLISLTPSIDRSYRKIYFLGVLDAMKNALMDSGPELLNKQKNLLRQLAVDRLVLENNFITGGDDIGEAYRRYYAERPDEDKTITLLNIDLQKLNHRCEADLSRDFYLAQCDMLDKIEPSLD